MSRVSLRLGLILALAAILAGTLLISAALTYRHASNKLAVEMQSATGTGQRTIELALQDIASSTEPRRQLELLVKTFDNDRHLRVGLVDETGKTVAQSTPTAPGTGMPEGLFRLIASEQQSVSIPLPQGVKTPGRIVVTADPRNEAAEVWADVKLQLSTLALFSALVFGLLSALLGYALRPLGQLQVGFETIGSGEFSGRVPAGGSAEFTRLSQGFNRMASLLGEMQDKNQQLNGQLERVQEEERASLARDLHDDVGPLLFSVDVDATTIRELARSGSNEKIAERAASIQEATAQVKEQVRSILWQLRPGELLNLGLANSIKNLIAFWKSRHPDLLFTVDVPDDTWAPQTDITLLSVVREAVSNALRHGKPSHIAIRISEAAHGQVEAIVEDNGSGLQTPSPLGSFGVVGMKERAKLAGGTLEISNRSVGAGVRVALRLPLDRGNTRKPTNEQKRSHTL